MKTLEYKVKMSIVDFIDSKLQDKIVQKFINKKLTPNEFNRYLNAIDGEVNIVMNRLTIEFLSK